MRAFTIHILGVIRYHRPDRNPLRRPIDRLHVRLTVVIGVLFLVLAPLAVALTARLADHAGLRAEREQTVARHLVNATVLATPSSVSRTGFGDNARIGWRDDAGRDHIAVVPATGDERPGAHRAIWVDRSGEMTTRPRRHAQTVADSVMAALTTLTLLTLAYSAARAFVERRLDRRRLDLWEREWAAVAPRWTGLP